MHLACCFLVFVHFADEDDAEDAYYDFAAELNTQPDPLSCLKSKFELSIILVTFSWSWAVL